MHTGFFAKRSRGTSTRIPPRPVVDDFSGNGNPQLLFSPDEGVVSLLPTYLIPTRNPAEFFTKIEPSASSPQLNGAIIGLGAGFLSFPGNRTSADVAGSGSTAALIPGAPATSLAPQGYQAHLPPSWRRGHPQHIVAVTDDYYVHLLDHKLSLVWSKAIVEPNYATMVPRSATVTVLPDRIYTGDVGCIVVAVKTKSVDDAEKLTISAFEGLTGELRWRHSLDDVAKSIDSTLLRPEQFKFSEGDLQSASENLDWTAFRESVVATLPHSWSHYWHTTMVPHAFVSEKSAKKRAAAWETDRDKDGKPKDRKQGTADTASSHEDATDGKSSAHGETLRGWLGFFGSTRKPRHAVASSKLNRVKRPLPNVLAVHTRHGVTMVHLFTGKSITTFGPAVPFVTYDDVDDDFRVERIDTLFGSRQTVAGRHAVEQVYDCKGRVMADAPLSEGDVLYEATICDSEGYIASLGYLKHVLHGDYYRGVGDAADGGAGAHYRDVLSRVGSHNVVSATTQGVTPLVVHTREAVNVNAFKLHRYSVFLVDSGTVTAISGRTKEVAWRTDTGSSFDPAKRQAGEVSATTYSQDERDTNVVSYPHLFAYHFHDAFSDPADVRNLHYQRHRHEPLVGIVGDTQLSFVTTKNGEPAAAIELPSVAIAPAIVADFNGDGTNDVVLVTEDGVYGWTVSRRPAATATSLLIFATVAGLLMLVISQRVHVDLDVDDPNETRVRFEGFDVGAAPSADATMPPGESVDRRREERREQIAMQRRYKRSTD